MVNGNVPSHVDLNNQMIIFWSRLLSQLIVVVKYIVNDEAFSIFIRPPLTEYLYTENFLYKYHLRVLISTNFISQLKQFTVIKQFSTSLLHTLCQFGSQSDIPLG